MNDQRNTILAVILSGLVLIAWQYFYNVPTMEKRQAEQKMQAQVTSPQPGTPSTAPAPQGSAQGTPQPGAVPVLDAQSGKRL